MEWTGLLVLLGGAFSICGAIFEWGIFMNHYKARIMIKLLGRRGARILYAVLGAVLVVLGLVILVVPPQ